MKTTKVVTLILSIFLFSNLLLAENKNEHYTKNLAKKCIEKLSIDVQLTDSQKLCIQKSELEYVQKYLVSETKIEKTKKKEIMDQSLKNFYNSINNILTPAQKDTIKSRKWREIQERITNTSK